MFPIPEFAREAIHTTRCGCTKHIFGDEDVSGLGLRDTGDGMVCFCVEVRCPLCFRHELLAVLNRRIGIKEFISELQELCDENDHSVPEVISRKYAPEAILDRKTLINCVETDGEGWSDPRRNYLVLLSRLSPMGITIWVKGILYATRATPLAVLGGYKSGRDVLILHRFEPKRRGRPHDRILRLFTDGGVEILDWDDPYSIEVSDWRRFGELPEGNRFRLAGREWQKMNSNGLERAVNRSAWFVRPKRKT